MVKIDPLRPLRPLKNYTKKKKKVVTGRDLLGRKGSERLVVPGSIDLRRFPGLAKIGTMDEPDAAPAAVEG